MIIFDNFCSTDIDECTTNNDNCDQDATCTNTIGSFTCTCNTGFFGDDVTCTGKYSKGHHAISSLFWKIILYQKKRYL